MLFIIACCKKNHIISKHCFGTCSHLLSINQCSIRNLGVEQKSLNWKIIPRNEVLEKKIKLATDTLVLVFPESKQINTSKDYTLLSSSLLLNTTNRAVSWVSLFSLKCYFSEAKGKFDCKHISFNIRDCKSTSACSIKSLKLYKFAPLTCVSNDQLCLLILFFLPFYFYFLWSIF